MRAWSSRLEDGSSFEKRFCFILSPLYFLSLDPSCLPLLNHPALSYWISYLCSFLSLLMLFLPLYPSLSFSFLFLSLFLHQYREFQVITLYTYSTVGVKNGERLKYMVVGCCQPFSNPSTLPSPGFLSYTETPSCRALYLRYFFVRSLSGHSNTSSSTPCFIERSGIQ